MLHHHTLITMAEAGVGVGVLPCLALQGAGHGQLCLLTIKDPETTRRAGTIMPRGVSLSPAVETMISEFLEGELETVILEP